MAYLVDGLFRGVNALEIAVCHGLDLLRRVQQLRQAGTKGGVRI